METCAKGCCTWVAGLWVHTVPCTGGGVCAMEHDAELQGHSFCPHSPEALLPGGETRALVDPGPEYAVYQDMGSLYWSVAQLVIGECSGHPIANRLTTQFRQFPNRSEAQVVADRMNRGERA